MAKRKSVSDSPCPICGERGGFHVDERRGRGLPGHAWARAHVPADVIARVKKLLEERRDG